MPTYTAQCSACQFRFAIYRKIDHRNDPANCEKCQAPAYRVLDAPRIVADYEPYSCPITGKEIRGRRQHEENLKQHGCRVYEPGELEEHKRYRAKEEEAHLDKLADAAADLALTLPQEKFEILTGELINGAEAPLINQTAPAAIPQTLTH